jgi:hypothetical protein
MKAGLLRVIDADECERQAALLVTEASGESNVAIQTALLSMAEGWNTLGKQIEWIASMRAK